MSHDEPVMSTEEALASMKAIPGRLAGVQAALECLNEELQGEKRRRRRSDRAFAVFCLLVAGAAAFFAVWNHDQDLVRARNHQVSVSRIARLEQQDAADLGRITRLQQQNVAFREGACAEAADWKEYLDAAPAGTPAGRKAAARIAARLKVLCAASAP